MTHPETCYSHDLENNCTVLKWGESGYYQTDYPKGGYTDEIIDELNRLGGVTPAMRKSMEYCSLMAQHNPDLDWESKYEEFLERFGNKKV